MVSTFVARPFFSSFTKKRQARETVIDENRTSPGMTVSDAVPTSPTLVASQARDNDMSYLRIPEIMGRQTRRLPQGDSGSGLTHWGEQEHAKRSNSDDSLSSAEVRRTAPAFFGQKPTFTEFNNTKHVKYDARKAVNRYLRHLATELETKNLVLNRKGTCFFYVDKFLVQLEVPQEGDTVTISTVVHRRIPRTDGRDSDESSQDSTQCSLQEDNQVKKILGQYVSPHEKKEPNCSLQFSETCLKLRGFCR